jgi:hypothetical protein
MMTYDLVRMALMRFETLIKACISYLMRPLAWLSDDLSCIGWEIR